MRREKGWDEQDPVQFQPVTHLFGSGQVAVMDGIERPTDDSESLWQNTPISDFELQIADLLMMRCAHGSSFRIPKSAMIPYLLICPFPKTMNLVEVSSSRPMGPRAWILVVEMPISAPRPNSKPSLSRVDAFTNTAEASTSR